MTKPSSPPGKSSPPLFPPNAESYYRPALFAAIAASVGVVIGSFAPWLSFLVLTVNGLDFSNWGTATLILGALSGFALVTMMFWERTPFNSGWAVPVAWGIAVAGVACLTDAVINIARIMTIPKSNFFGAPIGVSAGWGLWLVAFSAAVMCVTGAVVASHIAKSVVLLRPMRESGPPGIERWRWAAIITSALIVIGGIVYAATHPWKDESGSRDSSMTTLPPFPNFPSLPSFSTSPNLSTTTSSTMSQPSTTPSPPITTTVTTSSTYAEPTETGVSGSSCSDLGKLAHDVNTGKELYCAMFSQDQWMWLETPASVTGVHATNTSCDPRLEVMARSPDGYLITCQLPTGATSPYKATWQHFQSMLE